MSRRMWALLSLATSAVGAVLGAAALERAVAAPASAPLAVATARVGATAAPLASEPASTHFEGAHRDGRPRIGSARWRTWVWPSPVRSSSHLAIGALRIGTTVALKSAKPVSGNKWYAVEPFGFVYADATTTRDFDSPYWKALSSMAPRAGPWPYHYGFSTGAPMYSRIPTVAEQQRAERSLGPRRTFRPLGKWSEGHEVLIDTDPKHAIAAVDAVPAFFHGHQGIEGSPWNPANPKVKMVPAGSGVSYLRAFRAAGRVWLLTPDLLLVPADRVFPYRRSSFHGITLDARRRLPLAWVRGVSAGKLRLDAAGKLVPSGEHWPNKHHVLLDGQHRRRGGVTYWRTREHHGRDWIAQGAAATVVEAVERLRFDIGPDERWIWASITGGAMVAYVGLRPVWTTLWSGGLGGVPVRGNDPKRYHTTEVGVFPIQWKDEVATMSPDKGSPSVFWFPDVPHIQYVHAPLAIHVAYWHDNFGNLMSAECLNLSGADGAWLFDFTLPKVPRGWNSIRPHRLSGPSTKIRIVP